MSFTREVMKQYASSFNREINGRAVSSTDIKYFAKLRPGEPLVGMIGM